MVNENLPIHRLALKTEILDLEKCEYIMVYIYHLRCWISPGWFVWGVVVLASAPAQSNKA